VIRCIIVEAIAKNEYLLSSSSGVSNVAMYWEPVADGVSISAQRKHCVVSMRIRVSQ
jgi:hypothetical protein